jgi:hypothetical protein
MDICHQLARDAKQPSMNNADIIQQLSSFQQLCLIIYVFQEQKELCMGYVIGFPVNLS